MDENAMKERISDLEGAVSNLSRAMEVMFDFTVRHLEENEVLDRREFARIILEDHPKPAYGDDLNTVSFLLYRIASRILENDAEHQSWLENPDAGGMTD